jgi:cyclophilin family peptidyl-prolyl cis-trans isomerase
MMILHSCWGLTSSSSEVPSRTNSLGVVNRRNVIQATAIVPLWNCAASSASAAATTTTTTSPQRKQQQQRSITEETPIVTDRVYFDVRISRPDGTFYVRDDDDDELPTNRVFQTRLVFGLFGTIAPNHVQQFLRYVDSNPIVNEEDDNFPSYARSMFSRYDDATGIVYGGYIPGLQLTNFQGSSVLQYRGRLWPAKLWIESSNMNRENPQQSQIQPSASYWKQQGRGLLTHAALDPTPVFGITTRESSFIDTGTTTVFGQLQLDDDRSNNDSSLSNSLEFLQRVSNLPTYSMDRPVPVDRERTVLDETAETVFAAQRQLFRNAAKSIGDSRLDNLYPGKILRRVEVTRVGRL